MITKLAAMAVVAALLAATVVGGGTTLASNGSPVFDIAWGGYGSAGGQFIYPADVAVNPSSGQVYVADSGNDRIQRFDSNGTFLGAWGSRGSLDGQFYGPQGVAVNPSSGDVYVADWNNDRIQRFTATGDFLGAWGTEGSDNGEFHGPFAVAINPSTGAVYVADSGNSRIQWFSSTGSYLGTLGGPGQGEGEFDYPRAIAVNPSSGDIYVADGFLNLRIIGSPSNHRVQRFAASGAFLGEWTSQGAGEGQLWAPTSITVNPTSGEVHVAYGSGIRGVSTPPSTDVIQRFDSSGTFLSAWGSAGSGDGQFQDVWGIAADHSSGAFYVADFQDHRIKKFVPAPAGYQWSGFSGPVSDPPAVNALKSGAAVAVSFSLGGDRGPAIFATGYPKSVEVACSAAAPAEAVDGTVSAGQSELQYDPTTDTYTYVWKTSKAWAGTCRQLILKFDDGSSHWATFAFR